MSQYETARDALIKFVEANRGVFSVYVELLSQLQQAEEELTAQALALPWDEEHEVLPGMRRPKGRVRTKYDPGRLTQQELLTPGIVNTLNTAIVRQTLPPERQEQIAIVTRDKPAFKLAPFDPKEWV